MRGTAPAAFNFLMVGCSERQPEGGGQQGSHPGLKGIPMALIQDARPAFPIFGAPQLEATLHGGLPLQGYIEGFPLVSSQIQGIFMGGHRPHDGVVGVIETGTVGRERYLQPVRRKPRSSCQEIPTVIREDPEQFEGGRTHVIGLVVAKTWQAAAHVERTVEGTERGGGLVEVEPPGSIHGRPVPEFSRARSRAAGCRC
jgi:hypothetical protein